jgi:hypothetical protein
MSWWRCFTILIALSPLTHVNVDVEIDIGHAFLRRLVGAAFMPAPIAGAGVPDIGQSQAPPLWQRARTFSGELPRQHDLFAAFVGADDVRADFAGTAVIAAHDLLFGEDGVAEEGIGGAGHGIFFAKWLPSLSRIARRPEYKH